MRNLRGKSLAAGLAAFLALALGAWAYLEQLQASRQKAAVEVTSAFAQRLIERFHTSIAPVYIMASRVDPKSGAVRDFAENAAEIARSYPLLRAVELAPGGIVSHVYPMAGNEQIVGHDLLKDRQRNKEAWVAVSRREMAVAGPFELKQGGVGAIARYPLYRTLADGRQSFWGFSIVVVDFPALLRVAGVSELERAGYLFQFCWVPHTETACRTTLGDELPSRLAPVRTSLQLSSADWRIAVAPAQGWITSAEWALLAALLLCGAGLAGGAVYWYGAQRLADSDEETADGGLTTPAG